MFVSSGLRYDMILADQKQGDGYLRDLVNHHVSGQLKIAPEHTQDNVLKLMGNPAAAVCWNSRKNSIASMNKPEKTISDLLPDRSLSGLQRCGYAPIAAFHKRKAAYPSRTGTNLHTDPIYLRHIDVLHRDGSLYTPEALRR